MHTTAPWVQPIVSTVMAASAGRFGALVANVAASIGIVLGGVALARATGRLGSRAGAGPVTGSNRATVALALGLAGIALGALIVATADGGVGTGNGLGGGLVAMVSGLAAVVLGGMARVRERRLA